MDKEKKKKNESTRSKFGSRQAANILHLLNNCKQDKTKTKKSVDHWTCKVCWTKKKLNCLRVPAWNFSGDSLPERSLEFLLIGKQFQNFQKPSGNTTSETWSAFHLSFSPRLPHLLLGEPLSESKFPPELSLPDRLAGQMIWSSFFLCCK